MFFNIFFSTFLLFIFLNYWQTVACQNRESLSQLVSSKNVTPEKHKLITNFISIWKESDRPYARGKLFYVTFILQNY